MCPLVISVIIFCSLVCNQVNADECYEPLGCYGTPLASQGNPCTPESPQKQGIKYLLFTCDSQTISVNLTYNPSETDITGSGFDPQKETKIIIHGYLNGFYKYEATGIGITGASDWPSKMRDYTFRILCPNVQVIGVDWAPGASSINYVQAAANTKVVGDATAYFINRLIDTSNASPTRFHLIGHSLGAHVCGFAGIKFTNPQLNRITGLDPALPEFFIEDPNTLLDRTDATFVNTIHTGSGIITNNGIGYEGDPRPLSDCDFYINGGSQQPGCYPPPLFNYNPLDCDHQRSHDIPMADPSLAKNNCQLVAYNCDSYTKFLNGNCADCGLNSIGCKLLEFQFGYWDNPVNQQSNAPPNNKYYIKTNGSTPFCIYHYQIVAITNSLCSTISVTVNGVISTLTVLNPTPNGQCSGLFTTQIEIDSIKSVRIISILPAIVSELQINYMSNINKSIRDRKSIRFCDNRLVFPFSTFKQLCKT